MKIVAGLGCIDDYERLAKAGADEFFCGYVPYDWTKKYGVMLPLNRREVMYYQVNIGMITDLRILRKMVDKYQVPVKITLNSLFYTSEQYPMIAKIIEDCMEVGFDTFIIADVALLVYLRNHNIHCKIHLSGETAEVNRLMMKKLNEFNITRYIFHRKNSLSDMKSCIENNPVKGLEYEAFILNEWCHFTGGFCNSLHCDELTHICKVPYELEKLNTDSTGFQNVNEMMQREQQTMDDESSQTDQDDSELEQEVQYMTGQTGCGLCALMEMREAGVTHLKLVGRGNYTEYMVQDIMQLRKAIDWMNEAKDVNSYQNRIKNELFHGHCSENCYYR